MANALAWINAGAPFTYYSTFFDGIGAWINRGANLTGLSSSKLGLFSFWVNASNTAVGCEIISSFPDNNTFRSRIEANVPNTMGSRAFDAGDANPLFIISSSGNPADNAWHHIALSWDAGSASYSQFFDGSSDRILGAPNNVLADFNSVTDWGIGAGASGGFKLTGYLSEVYFTVPASYFDLSTNITKFRTVAGHPADLGANGSTPTGTQPLIYLHNPFSTFQNNLGSGGNFTVNGTLVDGGANIP